MENGASSYGHTLYTEVTTRLQKKMADTETESEAKIEFTSPAYACDEKKKDGFVRVIVAVKNMETSTDIVRRGILPKAVKKPSNAKVEMTFENEGFCLTVRGEKGGMKEKNIQLHIKKLPNEINSDKSYYEVEDDRVLLFLSKKQNKSWYPELDNGLETAEEEEGNQ